MVDELVTAFDSVKPGSPVWFHYEAPTGSGKTRIVQEFYRLLARERQDDPGYWPATMWSEDDESARLSSASSIRFEHERKQVNPRQFTKPEGAMPTWLWWGFTCGDRHGVRLSSLAHDVAQLEEHRPYLVDSLNHRTEALRQIRQRRGELGEALASEATDAALGVLGLAVPGVGLVSLLGKYAVSGAKAGAARRARRGVQRLDVLPDHSNVINDATEIVNLLGRAGLPVVVVVEDLHWADEPLVRLLDQLLSSTDAALLLLTTAWPGHTEDEYAEAALIFDGRHDAVLSRRQFTTDDGDTFAVLAIEDRIALVHALFPTISEPVARRLAERIASPLALQLAASLRSFRAMLEDPVTAYEAIEQLPMEASDLYRQAWDELDVDVQLGLSLASLATPSAVNTELGMRDDRWNTSHLGAEVLTAVAELLLEIAGSNRIDLDEAVDFGWAEEVAVELRRFTDPSKAVLARTFAQRNMTPDERGAFQRNLASFVTRRLPDTVDDELTEHASLLHLAAVSAGLLTPTTETLELGAALLWRMFATLGEQPEIEDLARFLDDLDRARVDASVEDDGDGDHRALIRLVLLQCAFSRGEAEQVERDLREVEAMVAASPPRIEIAFRRLSGRVARSLGRGREAADLFATLVERADQDLGPDDPDTDALRNDLAFARGRLGQLEEAEQIIVHLLSQADGRTEPRTTLRREHDLASLRRRIGRPAQATEMLIDLLGRQRALLGEHHPDVLSSLQLLGAAQRDSGQLDAATQSFTALVALRTQSLGPLHHDTLEARGHINWLGRRARRWDESLAPAREVLDERIKLFGQRHVTVADARRVLATVLMESGKLAEAEEILTPLFEGELGIGTNPAAASNQVCVARLRRYQGRLYDATRALDLATEAAADFDPTHLEVLTIRFHRALVTATAGDLERAATVLGELHEHQLNRLDTHHPELARTEVALAAIAARHSKQEMTLAWRERARSTAQGCDPSHEVWWLIEDPDRVLAGPAGV